MFLTYGVDVPMIRLPWVNWGLIVITLTVSVAAGCGMLSEPASGPTIEELAGKDPAENVDKLRQAVEAFRKKQTAPLPLALRPDHFETVQLVSSLVVHGGILHLFINMVFLFAFGNAVNAKLGHLLFLGCYMAAGIFSGLAWLLLGDGRPLVGASGAIMGIMGVFLVLYPKNDVKVWAAFAYSYAGTFTIPAYFLILGYLIGDLLGALGMQHGGVAYVCHVAGAWLGIAIGLILVGKRWVRPERYEETLLQALGFHKKPPKFEDVYWEEREQAWEAKKRSKNSSQDEDSV